jgi:hypothetical protein
MAVGARPWVRHLKYVDPSGRQRAWDMVGPRRAPLCTAAAGHRTHTSLRRFVAASR